jgi:nucleoside 2-deoxyribosyltransferase
MKKVIVPVFPTYKERLEIARRVEHKWVDITKNDRTPFEKKYIDSQLLEEGNLPIEQVISDIERIVGIVAGFGAEAKAHFEDRIKEWYPGAAKQYGDYIIKREI